MKKGNRNANRYALYRNKIDRLPTFIRQRFYDLRHEIEDANRRNDDFIIKDNVTGKTMSRDEAMEALQNAARKA